VKDPELSYTPKGTAVCKFTVACNRVFKQDDQLQKEVSLEKPADGAREE